jgi:diguanylate cyclase (GGDEF)-like protein/PAS domain S-box-containing protein
MSLRSRYGRLSLKTKLAFSVSCTMLLIVVTMTALALWVLHRDIDQSVANAQTVLVQSTAHDLDDKILQRREALALSAAVLTRASLPRPDELEAHFVTRPTLTGMFDAVFIADKDGKIVFDMPKVPGRRGISIAQRDYFKTLIETNAPVISPPMAGKISFEPSIVFTSPLRNPAGEVIGVLGGILFLSKPNFLGALGTERIGRNGYFELITKGDKPTVVMHAQYDRILKPAPDAKTNPYLAQALDGFEGTIENVNKRGREALVSYRSLRSAPWLLAAVYPTDEAYASMRERKAQILGVGMLLALVCGAGLWCFAGRLLFPLDQLRSVMLANTGNTGAPLTAPRVESKELAEVIDAYTALMEHKREFEVALRQSEERMRGIIKHAPDAFIGVDARGAITEWNRQAEKTFGWRRAEAVGRDVTGLLVPEAMRDWYEGRLRRFTQTGQGMAINNRVEATALHRSGRQIPVELSVVAVKNGDRYVANAFLRDISERKSAEQQLIASEQRLRAITDNLPVLISYVDRNQRYRFANATYEHWFGIETPYIIGCHVREVLGADWYEQARAHMELALEGKPETFEVETEIAGIKRHIQTVYIPHRDEDGGVAGLYILHTDVSALKAVERQLTLLARFDSLTGLPNRRHFDEKLTEAIARSGRSGSPMALMYLDIDLFKAINDTLGHAAGDEILKQFGNRLKESVRATDMVARLAGDEFVIILESVHAADEAELVARKIVLAMSKDFEIESLPLQVTTSIGIAFCESGGLPVADWMSKADQALYLAKAAGRNTFHLLSC